MDYGVVVPSYGEFADPVAIRDLVAAAEELGYGTAWFPDHIVVPTYAAHLTSPQWYDALACCLVGAGATTRLRLGTDVLVAPYRNPVVLAELLASADQLCGGRLTLGVGTGYISGEFAAVGAPPYERRGAVTTEFIRVMRALWESEGPVSFEGEFVQLRDVLAGPPPAQRPFPVWVGGNGPAGRRRAADHGTGWHPLFPTPQDYAAGRAEILARREAAGKDGPFTFSYSCPGCQVVLDRSELKPPPSYAELGEIPPEFSYAPPFPVADDGRLRFVGTPEELAADVTEYAAAGVEQLTLRFWTAEPDVTVDDVVAQWRRWMEHVAPAVEAGA